jgi:putative membrane protein
MKRFLFSASCLGLLALSSCSQSSDTNASGADSATGSAPTNTEAGAMDSSATGGMSGDTASAGAAGGGAMADPSGPTAPHSDDPTFMTSAAHSDQNEMQLSKLVLEKGATGMAKTHADMMITDHTNSTADLKAIAQKKNVKLPTDMDAEHKAIAEQMRKLSGKELEKKFMDQMVIDHQKTLNTMAAHKAMTKDTDLQTFITKTTPVIEKHLTMSKEHSGMM